MKLEMLAFSSETILNNEYHILMPIGQGGFSITYLAERLSNGETVVVKELFNQHYMERCLPDRSLRLKNDSYYERFISDKERFANEWKIMKQYEAYAGMVKPICFFEENRTAYIVMEHLPGGSLKDNIRKEGHDNAHLLMKEMMNVFDLLSAMHEHGDIHGDISPDNLVRCRNGSYKLIDFGAVKRAGIRDKSAEPLRKEGYTPAEVFNGRYCPDPRSDIYSLCAVLYYAFTGKAPIDALDRTIIDQILPLTDLQQDADHLISGMVMKGLSMDINGRWNDIGEILSVISQFNKSEDDRKREEEEKSRKKRILFTFGSAVIFVALIVLFYMTHRELIKFGGQETQKIVLFYDEDMKGSDIELLGNNIEKKARCIAGNDYLLKKENSWYELTTLKTVIDGLDLPSYINRFFNFERCAIGISLNETFLSLGNISQENIVSLEEQEEGLLICLSDDFSDRIQEGLDEGALFELKIYTSGSGNYMWDHDNTPYEGDSYIVGIEYNPSEGEIFVSDQALGGLVARRLFAECLSQSTVPINSFNYSRNVVWEQKQDTTWGKNQVESIQLSGETVLLGYLYRNPADYDVNMLNIEVSEEEIESNSNVIKLKKRLDTWGVPYACGWDGENEFKMYIQLKKENVWEIEAALLFGGLSNFIYEDIFIKSISGISFSAVDTDEDIECDGSIVRVKVDPAEQSFISKFNDMKEGIQLCLDGRPVFQTERLEVSEDGWIAFDTIILDNTEEPVSDFLPGFVDYLNLIKEEGPILPSYEFTGVTFYDSHGRPKWDRTVWDLQGCEQTSLRVRLEQYFSATDLSVNWHPSSPDHVYVTGLYEKELRDQYNHPYAITEELLKSIDLTNEISELGINIIVPRSNTIWNTQYMYYQMNVSRNTLTGAYDIRWYPELWNHNMVSADPEDDELYIKSSIEEARNYLSSSEFFRSCYMKPALSIRTDKVVLDQADLSVKLAVQDTLPGQDYQFSFQIENKTSDVIKIKIDEASINNIMPSLLYSSYIIPPDIESDIYLNLTAKELLFSPMDTLKNAQFGFTVNDDINSHYSVVLPDLETVRQDMQDLVIPVDAKLMIDEEKYSIYSNGFGNYEEMGVHRQANLILVNKTKDPIRFRYENLGYNSEWDMFFDSDHADVLPFSVLYSNVRYSDLSLAYLNLEDEDLDYISVVMSAYDLENGSLLLQNEEFHIFR